ncbi:hypothetical protein [Serratia sp. JSRIV004]|uniref:hypothetical protein n=1 Tax=Serratia sp. JSRIV004 TaxID=2831895 RepID=UPI001CC06131|nr:hypothetical protein [Serratia sp. JSRIV004]UAN58995.1 hypothetical protein KGP21_08085 [Serratia sp. JSRIV004]UAN59622.1 hypothetical protein KGP21_11460 [Serratia sp. JSRIV004]
MDKQDIQHWTGEGLPPVGTVCEFYDREEWSEVLVKFIGDKYAVLQDERYSVERVYCVADKPQKFRPIRTPEQIEAERRERISEQITVQYVIGNGNSTVGQRIYDAIRAGKIEGVKIDG